MSTKKPKPQPDPRAKRLSQALKANLARRKAAKKLIPGARSETRDPRKD